MRDAEESPAFAAGQLRPLINRGTDGFFRAGQDGKGRWWLFDSSGAPFFLRGVHEVRRPHEHDDTAVVPDPAARLRHWGFNALGLGGDPVLRDDGLPFVASAEFCAVSHVIMAPGVRLPDVFAPDWPQKLAARAREICRPLAESRELVGWVTDNGLEWATPSGAGRPSLLQRCLSLEPAYAAYHAAWEFVLAHHGGRLEHVAHAWHARLPNKETVRELTRAEEGLGTRGYLRDEARWTREFARRYFAATAAALREADPNHLVLGCRFRGSAGTSVLAECTYPVIDVTLANWLEVPAQTHASQPVLADNVNWVAEDFLRTARPTRTARLTTFERMLRKARTALDRMARHPAVVGYAWAQWQDEPGEQPPFAGGLFHVNGVAAREHLELLTPYNLRAENLHRG